MKQIPFYIIVIFNILISCQPHSSFLTEQKIIASDGNSGDFFGQSVSISSNGYSLAVGTGFGGNTVYIYKWNGVSWDETKIIASDGDSEDHFGNSVSLSSDGNTLAVSAFWDDNGSDSGSVYVYKWNGTAWDETKMIASDGDSQDNFGSSVSVSSAGDTIAVGAYFDDDNGSDSGSVYVYKWNGTSWDETKIIASDGDSEDHFGYSVSISSDGNYLAVGSVDDDDNGYDSGSIYIYEHDKPSWDETKIIASDGDSEDSFGNSISISSDGLSIAVGAYLDDDNGSASGSVYVFTYGQ